MNEPNESSQAGEGAAPADVEEMVPEGERTSPDETAPEAGSPEQRLAALTEERDRVKEQLLRTAADYENFRKRAKRDVEEAERRGREEVLREVLPVIDNLERAVEASDSATDVKAVVEGVRMVLKMFEDVAGRIELQRIPAVGEKFDPTLHDAMQQRETSEQPPGTIVQELVPGYKLGERLLRPSLVVVARPPAEGTGS